jgi:hypothetical protein
MRSASVRYTGTGCELRTPYDEAYLADFKGTVPHSARQWDGERKLWLIQESFVDVALAIVRRYFQLLELNARQHQQHYTGSSEQPSTAYAVLHLRADAPIEVVKAAYKALAQLHHPDHKGDLTKMQQINQAYEKLTK